MYYMESAVSKKRKAIFIIFLMVGILIFSRSITISHNMYLHCDEHVFYNAAQSLKGYLSGSSPVYEEEKEYPEGAIVLQLPFHILTAIINRLTGAGISPQLSGRVASVFYFICAAILGFVIVFRYFSARAHTLIIYSLIVSFSIMHIEQSRYGTGDAISFFLLMAVILLTAAAISSDRHAFALIVFSAFVAGGLCAVKYPLIVFFSITVFGAISLCKKGLKISKPLFAVILLFAFYIGFAILSPKAAFDPSYIWRASTRELGAYMGTEGSRLALLWKNTLSVLTYSMFYSGFPMMPVFLTITFAQRWRTVDNTNYLSILFNRMIPALVVIFFMYNLSVATLAMRSFYPFFFIGDIYVSAYIGNLLFSSSNFKRTIILILTGILSLRGAYLIFLMSDNSDSSRMSHMIADAVDSKWNKTTVLSGQLIFADGYQEFPGLNIVDITDERFSNPETMIVQEGELMITGARSFENGTFEFDFLPFDFGTNQTLLKWLEIEKENEPYYVGRLYPEYYYYLFGSWIYGATGNGAEFPNCTIYYRG